MLLFLLLSLACGGVQPTPGVVERSPGRKLALWVRSDFSRDDAQRLKNVGFDEFVVYRGVIDLSAGAPVLRLVAGPELGPGFIQTPVLGLKTGGLGLNANNAEVLWSALKGALGSTSRGMILDIREIPEGIGEFIADLQRVSGVPVIPLLGSEQLSDLKVRGLVIQAGECIIPLYGVSGPGFRIPSSRNNLGLRKTLEPLKETGVRVRVGIGMEPLFKPELKSWGGDLDLLLGPLAEPVVAKQLDRAFVFRKDCSWGGRNWVRGDRLEASWMDASRLAAAFRESDRLILPELSGWDLFGAPPQGKIVGLDREGLLAFMVGRGPAPEILILHEKRGRSHRIRVVNRSPFASALSKQGQWLEVSIPAGSLVVRGGGSFDGVVLGSLRSGRWTPGMSDRVDAVRFYEDYIGPGEEIETGAITLPSSRTGLNATLRILLSDGREIRRQASW